MIIDKYLLREVAAPFFAISFALTTLFVTYSLTHYLTDATEGVLAADAVFTLTLLKALIALEMLLPVSLYVALIVAMGRLYSDWEITGLKASGISERRIILPIMALAVVVALGIAALSLWARPWAYDELYRFQAEAKAFNDLDQLGAGRFHYDDKRDRVVFMDARQGNSELSGLFVRTRVGEDTQVISATSGSFDAYARPDRHRLNLFDARVFRLGAEGRNLLGRFDEFTLWLPTAIPDPVGYKPKRMSTSELGRSPAPDARAELQWRQSTAISALLLALLAVPLSRTQPRRGRYSKVMLAVVIYALYYNLVGVARTGVEQQATASLWWAPGLLLGVVLIAFLAGRRQPS
ncbi:MAG: LPS export ABC transporter permease LptF [Pseudomonadales bacterium]